MDTKNILQKLIYNSFRETNSDKFLHGYEATYAKILDCFSINSLLEVGILHGWSLLAWRKILGNRAAIMGVDLRVPMDFGDARLIKNKILFEYGIDSVKKNRTYDPAVVIGKKLFKRNEDFIKWSVDMIIDDGSHKGIDQLQTFRNFRGHWTYAYVIEDILNDESLDLLKQKISEMGYSIYVDQSTRHMRTKDKIYQTPMYIMVVTRNGSSFGNADS